MSKVSKKNIGLVVKANLFEAYPEIELIFDWAKSNGFHIKVEPNTQHVLTHLDKDHGKKFLPACSIGTLEELITTCDVVITLGGDGTLIAAARLFHQGSKAVMLGVNFGTLGYLTEVKASELAQILPLVALGTAPVEHRSMIIGEVYDSDGSRIFSAAALNDVVIVKGLRERLLRMNVKVNGHPLAEFRGDGIVLATPTGSTAYSLAAGGSIVYPSVPVTLLTPICPHALTIRPLILPADQLIEIEIPESGEEVFVTVDGQQTHNLLNGQTVKITKAPYTVPLVRSSNRSYFDVLKTKLNWGIPNRAD